jgi:hypothetical protein
MVNMVLTFSENKAIEILEPLFVRCLRQPAESAKMKKMELLTIMSNGDWTGGRRRHLIPG